MTIARRTVLITGAAGNIGSVYAAHAAAQYQLRLLDRSDDELSEVAPFGDPFAADLADTSALEEACAGIDTVLHLAADPNVDAPWDSVLPSNIVGTFNVFEAAASAGCRRVVFASSVHAVMGHPPDRQVHADDPVNPDSLYGVSKCFGEALGRFYAEQRGMSCIAVRIGAFQPVEAAAGDEGPEMLDYFVSERDLCQLFDRCVELDDGPPFLIVHGLSDNRFKRLDLTDTRAATGYDPVDDVADRHPGLREVLPER